MNSEEFTAWIISTFESNEKITLIVTETDLSKDIWTAPAFVEGLLIVENPIVQEMNV